MWNKPYPKSVCARCGRYSSLQPCRPCREVERLQTELAAQILDKQTVLNSTDRLRRERDEARAELAETRQLVEVVATRRDNALRLLYEARDDVERLQTELADEEYRAVTALSDVDAARRERDEARAALAAAREAKYEQVGFIHVDGTMVDMSVLTVRDFRESPMVTANPDWTPLFRAGSSRMGDKT